MASKRNRFLLESLQVLIVKNYQITSWSFGESLFVGFSSRQLCFVVTVVVIIVIVVIVITTEDSHIIFAHFFVNRNEALTVTTSQDHQPSILDPNTLDLPQLTLLIATRSLCGTHNAAKRFAI